jgi:hypothetical protein
MPVIVSKKIAKPTAKTIPVIGIKKAKTIPKRESHLV